VEPYCSAFRCNMPCCSCNMPYCALCCNTPWARLRVLSGRDGEGGGGGAPVEPAPDGVGARGEEPRGVGAGLRRGTARSPEVSRAWRQSW
jgi:hypothetical protein